VSSALHVQIRREPAAAVIELHGDLNSDGEAAVKGAYEQVTADGASTVLLDLSHTQYINTSGISVLITVAMAAKKAGNIILVAGASPHYKKVFDLVRFSSFVTMFDTEAEALASLA
jgi:anti-anti-sigma factor